jgi:hypothetical protein
MEAEPQRRVLSDAHDGSQLYHLLLPIVNDPSASLVRVERALSLDEAKTAVRESLLTGDIFLSETSDMDTPLPLDDALALIADESVWKPGRSPRHLLLNLTDRGEETYDRLAALWRHS